MNNHKVTVEVLKRNSIQKDMLLLTIGQEVYIQILDGKYKHERFSFTVDTNFKTQFDDSSDTPTHKCQFTASEVCECPEETGIHKQSLCEDCYQPYKKYPYKRKPNIADALFVPRELECVLTFGIYEYRVKIKPHDPSIIYQRTKNSNIDTSSSSSERAYNTLKVL